MAGKLQDSDGVFSLVNAYLKRFRINLSYFALCFSATRLLLFSAAPFFPLACHLFMRQQICYQQHICRSIYVQFARNKRSSLSQSNIGVLPPNRELQQHNSSVEIDRTVA
jgi:hypothetical protein